MKILAVDYGDARTGVAICDKSELLASPVGVINQRNPEKVIEEIVELAKENRAELIIIGNPINMDGSHGGRSQSCSLFGEQLKLAVNLPVKMWDERSTTVSATHFLNETDTRGKKRKQVIDQVAATIILESYLNWRKHHPNEI